MDHTSNVIPTSGECKAKNETMFDSLAQWRSESLNTRLPCYALSMELRGSSGSVADPLCLDGGWDSSYGDCKLRSRQTLSGGFAGMSAEKDATPWFVQHRATLSLSLLVWIVT